MKAIIPVAGAGTRLRPLTYTQPKALIPVAGKPILDFIIEQLQDVGIEEFIFVVGYLSEKIESHVKLKHPDIKAHFIQQNDRKGLGHAIWLTKDLLQDDKDVLVILGDTIVETELKAFIDSPVSMLGVRKVEDPRNFGVAEFGEGNEIKRVVEKPLIPKSNMALVGVYKIKEVGKLFEVLDYNIQNKVKTRNEYHLTDAIMDMIELGVQFTGYKVNNWYDCGKRDILLQTNATLLKKTGFISHDHPVHENTIIINPVNIGPGVVISNSIIGPNVTIGENAKIQFSTVRDSIIGNYTHLQEVMLHHSVIGSDAVVKGVSQSLNIGDNTEIDLSGESNV